MDIKNRGSAYKQRVVLLLLGLAVLFSGPVTGQDDSAPKVYVARCNFEYSGKACGVLVRNVIFQKSDEFLTFTDYWAVGRAGSYKMYMSCFGPGDEPYRDGTFYSLTVVVAGPDLLKAHEISSQLKLEFSEQLSGQTGDISHCIEK